MVLSLTEPPHFSYNTYNYVAFIGPLILLGVSLLLMMVCVYTIIMVCWPFKKDLTKLADEEIPHKLMSEFREGGNKIPCWTCIFGGLKLVYGHQINECVHKIPHETNIYTICGRHVRPWLLVVLFMVVAFIFSCTLVAFWCEFLVDEGDRCDYHMDCFVKDDTGELIQQEPLLDNCTEYQNNNYTIHCFRFTFDYATALGDAGGILVLGTVIMNVQAGLWIGASSQRGNCAWYFAVTGVTVLNLLVEAGLIATPIVVQFVPLFRDRIINTDRNAVQFYTYWATFLCTFTISGPIFIIFSKRLRRQTTIDGQEQYISVNSRQMHDHSTANSDSESDGELNLSDWHKNTYGAA